MEQFLSFFENLSSVQKILWVAIAMGIFWLIEGAFPLFNHSYKKWQHAKTNLFLLTFSILINAVFGLATAGVFLWTQSHHFGVLQWLNFPIWFSFFFSILMLDFIGQYVVHFLLHKVKFMWKFHMVHHSDTIVDVTTGTRHHPGDYLMREVFGIVTVFLFGIPFAYYMFYRIATIFFTYFSHANYSLPPWLDKALSWIFITPDMHKFHHHFERPWTDTNFGNIFSFWDRLFGTLVYDDVHQVRYGLDVLDDQTSLDLKYQLRLPFDPKIKTDY